MTLKKTAVSTGAALGLLLLAEQATRVALFGAGAFSVRRLHSERGAEILRASAVPGLALELPPGLDAEFKGVPLRANALGMADEERTPAKPRGAFRIAVLGDSYSTPWGVPREQGWVSRLQGSLREDGARVEVLDFAVPGYGPEEYAAVLERKALAFAPDLVLVGWCGENDHLEGNGKAFAELYRERRGDGLKASYLADWLRTAWRAEAPRPRYTPAERAFVSRELAALRSLAGKVPLVVVQLGMRDPRSAELGELVAGAGARFLDAGAPFFGKPLRPWTLNALDLHPNAAAHEVYAREIAGWLRAERLVPIKGRD